MIIRINQKNCIQLESVIYTSLDFVKTKGGPDVPVHTVYLIGGKGLVVSYVDAIQILFPETNVKEQTPPPPPEQGQVIQMHAAPNYAEDINTPEEYIVLKSFTAANDPSLYIPSGTSLKKGKVNGLTKWVSDKNDKWIFDFQALQNAEFFGLPGATPTPAINEIPTPNIDKKPK